MTIAIWVIGLLFVGIIIGCLVWAEPSDEERLRYRNLIRKAQADRIISEARQQMKDHVADRTKASWRRW